MKDDFVVSGMVDALSCPGKTGEKPIAAAVIFAGNTTYDTQAAVEFMAQRKLRHATAQSARCSARPQVPYFEALLEVKIRRDVPIWSKVIAVRPYTAGNSSWQTPAPTKVDSLRSERQPQSEFNYARIT